MDVNQHLFSRSQKPITSVFDRLYPAEDEDNKVIIFPAWLRNRLLSAGFEPVLMKNHV